MQGMTNQEIIIESLSRSLEGVMVKPHRRTPPSPKRRARLPTLGEVLERLWNLEEDAVSARGLYLVSPQESWDLLSALEGTGVSRVSLCVVRGEVDTAALESWGYTAKRLGKLLFITK